MAILYEIDDIVPRIPGIDKLAVNRGSRSIGEGYNVGSRRDQQYEYLHMPANILRRSGRHWFGRGPCNLSQSEM